jgi:hypothetical protein
MRDDLAGLMTPDAVGLLRVFDRQWGMRIFREYTYAFGAVSPHDGPLDSLILPVVTAKAMSIFLEEVTRRHPEEFILMFLDWAGWHRAKDLTVPENMRLEALSTTLQPPTQPRGAYLG